MTYEKYLSQFEGLQNRAANMSNILMNFPMTRERNCAAANLLMELRMEIKRLEAALEAKEDTRPAGLEPAA